jgi:hypothetical protein
MRKIYFIDTENVGNNWISLLKYSHSTDRFFLFYTRKSPKLDYDTLRLLLRLAPWRVKLFFCQNSRHNALDFQLSTVLGHYVRRFRRIEYVIVSNDTGYDPVVTFWFHRGRHISRRPLTLAPHYGDATNTCTGSGEPFSTLKINPDYRARLEYLKKSTCAAGISLPKSFARDVVLYSFQTKEKTEIHQRLVKKYGQVKVDKYYSVIRPCLDHLLTGTFS